MLERPLLKATTEWQPEMFRELEDHFDQINLMTYDFSGPWDGWVSWHNSPLYNGNRTFPNNTRELPAVDNDVNWFLNAGIPGEKLGIGIVFTGYVWKGFVYAPLQEWITAPEVTSNVPHYQIMQEYYREETERWDDEAKAPYLSISGLDPLDYIFISYENERSIQKKFNYIRNKGLGGTIIWELGNGFDRNRPPGQRDPLLQAVKQELWN
jgi:chitinase